MKLMTYNIITLFLIVFLVIASIGLGYIAEPQIEGLVSSVQGRYVDTPEECNDLDLVDTAYCLRNYIKPFYKYKVTQDLIKLDIEDLKLNGGDCKNWAEFYYDQGKELGFYVTRPVAIMKKGDTAHTFTIMSDETGYCILDQLNVRCSSLS